MFQSTHPHGVRPPCHATCNTSQWVSIHAPTRGATCILFYCSEMTYSFNPRTHTGCDSYCSAQYRCFREFQSTHPHGVRLCRYVVATWYTCFNPRTHTGCDRSSRGGRSFKVSFNPRTHTGCDMRVRDIDFVISVSIHAPTRGATRLALS